MSEENIQLKVRIPSELNRRLKQYVTTKYPDFLRGPLSKEVERAIIQYLDTQEEKEKYREEIVEHTHA